MHDPLIGTNFLGTACVYMILIKLIIGYGWYSWTLSIQREGTSKQQGSLGESMQICQNIGGNISIKGDFNL